MKKSKQNTAKLSLYAYWRKHIKGFMCYQVFCSNYETLMGDAEFVKNFGTYRGRSLTPKQVKLLNEEFAYNE